MKRTTALAFLAATLISMTAAPGHAQAGIVEAKIPFDFNVGDQAFPAGGYRISYATQTAILVSSLDGRFHAMTAIYPADGRPGGHGVLVFTQYGNHYFLHEALCSAADMNVAVPTSRLEKLARVQEARLAGTQTVAALHVGAK